MSSTPTANPEQPIDAPADKLTRTRLQHSTSSTPGHQTVRALSCRPKLGSHYRPILGHIEH